MPEDSISAWDYRARKRFLNRNRSCRMSRVSTHAVQMCQPTDTWAGDCPNEVCAPLSQLGLTSGDLCHTNGQLLFVTCLR